MKDETCVETVAIEIPEGAIGWFHTFVDRTYFDTFLNLAKDGNVEEAYSLRDAVYAINNAIHKAEENGRG